MNLVHRTRIEQGSNCQSDIDRLLVETVRRFLVQLDQVRGFRVCLVFDRAALVEFEEYRWVYLAQLALGRSKPTLNYQRRRLGRENGWTITKQLVAGV
jgi:hypothetical protein